MPLSSISLNAKPANAGIRDLIVLFKKEFFFPSHLSQSSSPF